MQSDCYYSRVRKEWVKIDDTSIIEMAYGTSLSSGTDTTTNYRAISMKNIPDDGNWLSNYESASKVDGVENAGVSPKSTFEPSIHGFIDAFSAIASIDSWTCLLCGPVSNKEGQMKEVKTSTSFHDKMAYIEAMKAEAAIDHYYSPVRQTWTTLDSKPMADIAYGTVLDSDTAWEESIYSFESPSAAVQDELPRARTGRDADSMHETASEFTADFILRPRSQIWSAGDPAAVESVLRAQFAMTDAELDELRSLISASSPSRDLEGGDRRSDGDGDAVRNAPRKQSEDAPADGTNPRHGEDRGQDGRPPPSSPVARRRQGAGHPPAGFRYVYDDVLDIWRLEYHGGAGVEGPAWDHGARLAAALEARAHPTNALSHKSAFLTQHRSSLAAGAQQALRERLTAIRAAEARDALPSHKTYQLRTSMGVTSPLVVERVPTDHLGRSHVVTDVNGTSWMR